MKITDKRMFTPEGDLREGGVEGDEEKQTPSPGEPSQPEPPSPEPPREPIAEADQDEMGPIPAAATFAHLVAFLAEPAAIYLGDVELPDGRSAENLDLARFHIDLLELLKEKASGSLSEDESTGLEELLYSLRLRYVQKRG